MFCVLAETPGNTVQPGSGAGARLVPFSALQVDWRQQAPKGLALTLRKGGLQGPGQVAGVSESSIWPSGSSTSPPPGGRQQVFFRLIKKITLIL